MLKAREALGDAAPTFRDDSGVLGKRRRTHKHEGNPWSDSEADDDVPEDVRRIPMPRDTPPPIPKEEMDRWHAKRREAWLRRHGGGAGDAGTKANAEPVAARDGRPKPEAPPPVAKTVYEAKPVVRNLQQEAVSAFVPTAVRMKLERAKGTSGHLMEPEEADELEREGYLKTAASTSAAQTQQVRPEREEDAGPSVTAGAPEEENDEEGEYDDFGTRRVPRATVEDAEDDGM